MLAAKNISRASFVIMLCNKKLEKDRRKVLVLMLTGTDNGLTKISTLYICGVIFHTLQNQIIEVSITKGIYRVYYKIENKLLFQRPVIKLISGAGVHQSIIEIVLQYFNRISILLFVFMKFISHHINDMHGCQKRLDFIQKNEFLLQDTIRQTSHLYRTFTFTCRT